MVPGWPRALVHAGHEDFAEQAVKWLLDQGPAELRTSVLRQYPIALASYLHAYLTGALDGARRAYGSARTDLAEHVESAQIAIVQEAVAAEGARLVARVREVDLVLQALQRPVPRP